MREAMLKRIEAQNREDLFEERAAIMEFCGCMKRVDAERKARAEYPVIQNKETLC